MWSFRLGRSGASLFLWGLQPGVLQGVYASLSSSPSWSHTDNYFSDFFFSLKDFYVLFGIVEYPDCLHDSAFPAFISDGHCDLDNNNEECGYDGGDCCVCTCEDTQDYTCGDAEGFLCLDPQVPEDCKEESNSHLPSLPSTTEHWFNQYPGCYEVGGWAPGIGNGYCDIENSNEGCAYDGGDCCSCTCIDTHHNSCGLNGGYYCRDPSVSEECRKESASFVTYVPSTMGYLLSQYPGCYEANGWAPIIGDGHCDYSNSIEECGYDGGDCCSCTCVDGDVYTCGGNAYLCRDPTVSAECMEESAPYDPFLSSSTHWYRPDQYPDCIAAGGYVYGVGDAYCDNENNIAECGYDGGDCCSCTCEDSDYGGCGEYSGFECLDPSVSGRCVEDSNTFVPSSSLFWLPYMENPECSTAGGHPYGIGDGYCDFDNNNEECSYDGGDCCLCTCVDTAYVPCGEHNGYFCRDPAVSQDCREESASYIPSYALSSFWYHINHYPDCYDAGGWVGGIGNGHCDFQNSNEECGYDGGDCCACTCVDTEENTCGEDGGYYCRDPAVSESRLEESASYIPIASSAYLYHFSQYPGCYEVGGHAASIGDGYCNFSNNNEECSFDGGDCCSCTCERSMYAWCGAHGYDCRDTTVPSACIESSTSENHLSST